MHREADSWREHHQHAEEERDGVYRRGEIKQRGGGDRKKGGSEGLRVGGGRNKMQEEKGGEREGRVLLQG